MPEISTLNAMMTASITGFSAGMAQGKREVESFSETFKNAAESATRAAETIGIALGIGGLAEYLHGASESIEKTLKLSDSLGIATQRLSGLEYAANVSGIETEAFNQKLEKLTVSLGKARTEGGSARVAMTDLGVSAQLIAHGNTDQVLLAIADGMQHMNDASRRAADAQEIFGRGSVEMEALLLKGSSAIEAYIEHAKEMGISVDRDQAEKVVQANEAMKDFEASIGGLANQLEVALAPAMTAIANDATKLIEEFESLSPVTKMVAGEALKWGAALTAAAFIAPAVVSGAIGIAEALKAVSISEALVQAFSGPKGWATMAVGAAVAAGAIYGIDRAMDSATQGTKNLKDGANGATRALNEMASTPAYQQTVNEMAKLNDEADKTQRQILGAAQAHEMELQMGKQAFEEEKLLIAGANGEAIKLYESTQANIKALEGMQAGQKILDDLSHSWAELGRTKAQQAADEVKLAGGTAAQAAHAEKIQAAIEAQEASQKKAEEYGAEAMKFFEATRTPAEHMADQVAEINKLFQAGKLDVDTYHRALQQAQDALDKTIDKQDRLKHFEVSAPDAMLAGSSEAANFVAKFQNQQRENQREAEIAANTKTANEHLTQIAAAVHSPSSKLVVLDMGSV